MAYSEKLLDHYENPRNVGSFAKDDDAVGTGMVGAPACGDVMKLQIRVGADGLIEDAKFKTYGCGSAIASSSLVTEWVKGKSLDEALSIKNTQIAEDGFRRRDAPLLRRCPAGPIRREQSTAACLRAGLGRWCRNRPDAR